MQGRLCTYQSGYQGRVRDLATVGCRWYLATRLDELTGQWTQREMRSDCGALGGSRVRR